MQDSLDLLSSAAYHNIINENQVRLVRAQANYQRELQDCEDLRRQRLGAMADRLDEMGTSSQETVNTYFMRISELSWINIDRFMKLDCIETRMITLKDNDPREGRVMLVFKNTNSVLPIKVAKRARKYVRDRVPQNEAVYLLAYKVVDGKTMLYLKDLDPKRNEYETEYKPYSFK
ncbi:MAG: hypothetical protein U5L96_00355 [Owenweeksia sp.]|nr:hypothetical protein [Owenweeksia sp.]